MLLQKFEAYCKEQLSLYAAGNSRLLLAVSGGIDSVVLTHLVAACGFPFAVAHCNFGLRGAESARDEAFVNALAAQYKAPFFIKKFDTAAYAAQHKLSIQEAARKLRYDWFREVVGDTWKEDNSWQLADDRNKQQLKTANNIHTADQALPSAVSHLSTFIATAHHANDNIETLLINFFRGTGISGLHGILPKQNNIIRPLLFATKEQIVQYAADRQLSWVEDSSNASDKYTRNFFRHQLIPAIKGLFPQAEENLLQNIHRFGEAEQLYNQAVALHKHKLVAAKGAELHIPVLKLQKTTPLHTITWEIIKDFGFATAQVNDVVKLLGAENGRYVASRTYRIIKNRNWLVIAPAQTTVAQHILIEAKDREVVYEEGVIQLKNIQYSKFNIQHSNNVAMLDAALIQYPLLLRKWKAGDYFYPLGMKKKKKLARFFIDLKLSKTDKEKVWVIEMDKKIVWVVGHRIDDRFKITAKTANLLQLQSSSL